MKTLICTVGGSPQPIMTALRRRHWRFVTFLCSGEEPERGTAGSMCMLLEIVEQVGLAPDSYDAATLPADDLDCAFAVARDALAALRKRFPAASIYADYTGGTKTMGVALALAAIGEPSVVLQLVTGERKDLVRVRDGSEKAVRAPIELVRLGRAIDLAKGAWERYGYQEAAASFAILRQDLERLPSAPQPLKTSVRYLHKLSEAFAAWDRFHYAEAKNTVIHSARHVGGLNPFAAPITLLADPRRREPLILLDLFRNAERWAVRGRLDDALARLYRLIEWTAQWLLRSRLGVDTAKVPIKWMPEAMRSARGAIDSDTQKVGLLEAWQLICEHLPDSPAGHFMNGDHGGTAVQIGEMGKLLQVRNNSFLAHRDRPIRPTDWDRFYSWVRDGLIPIVAEEAKLTNAPFELPQLPRQPPELIRQPV